jgi:hypothetical protein
MAFFAEVRHYYLSFIRQITSISEKHNIVVYGVHYILYESHVIGGHIFFYEIRLH